MNIYFSGSHGTGKTTLVENLYTPLNLIKIKEIFRSVMDAGVYKQGTLEIQQNVASVMYGISTQLQQNFISDRSLIDVMAYSELQNFATDDIEIYLKNLNYYKNDLIIFTPIEFPLVKDGVRFEGKEFQQQVEDKILEILARYKINYKVVSGSVESRIKQVKAFYQEKK